ncbi:MAG TPA: hypothetical protein VD968_04595, partial [Pyrinomonadaceae bacterium]|nr:hypothetical protein [Pyrinomonadaceae bacterium]
APSAFGQAEYSDSYSVDGSGYSHDPGSDTLVLTEGAPDPVVVGVGVAEDAYDSGTYETSTSTVLTSPDGSSASSTSDGWYYARAEAAMGMNVETAVEGEYKVESQHTYYRVQEEQPCYDYSMPCYQAKARPDSLFGAMFMPASYTPLRASAARPRAYPYYFTIIRFTRFFFFLSTVYTGYQNSGFIGCGGNTPWAYLLWCADTRNCGFRARICAGFGADFLQGTALRISYYWGNVCITRFRYIYHPPRCS